MNKAIQPLDFIASNKMGFFDGGVIECLSRHLETRDIEDLKKASVYLQKMIEMEEIEPPKNCEEIEEAPVVAVVRKKAGRPPKAPWGYRANGKPYLRRPKNWKGD